MTKKQKIFADEYLIDLNATRAYRVAYPSVKKDETAKSAGSRMLTNVNVAKYISERMQERQQRTEVTQDMVVKELAAIAFARATRNWRPLLLPGQLITPRLGVAQCALRTRTLYPTSKFERFPASRKAQMALRSS